MKNAATYLNFQRKMGQLNTNEKWFIVNQMVNYLVSERFKNILPFVDEDNLALEIHLRQPIAVQNTERWWLTLRELSRATLFYKTLRLI